MKDRVKVKVKVKDREDSTRKFTRGLKQITLCREKLRVHHVQLFREKLDYRVRYHCEEKNTRSLISRRKACQDKWVLALSQANTNEKPRHGDLL